MKKTRAFVWISVGLLSLGLNGAAQAQHSKMTFFVSSVGAGKGADFGGIEGADKHCQRLAWQVGAGYRTWRAYLSQSAWGSDLPINARDRIGKGPWQNAKGVVIANNLEELHGNNNINKQTALTEWGDIVPGRGDKPNMHDILTGSRPDGTAFWGSEDRTCGNWRKGGADGQAMVGHHDRIGLRDDEASRSWNSSHLSRGCSLEHLRMSGGAGLIYCFAAD